METMSRALITTAYGQDSIFLGRLLRRKGYEVLVLNHRNSAPVDFGHFDSFVDLDVTRTDQLVDLIADFQPNEIYNLAAVSSVAYSWINPVIVNEVNGLAIERLVSRLRPSDKQIIKFFQPGSTDMVGKKIVESRESEFNPWSPYGKSKEIARQAVVNARTKGDLWAVNGILTNHDSEYRQDGFVIPKIANQIIEVLNGNREHVELQNPLVTRDWAHADDIMEAAWRMMQNPEPEDFALGTGLSLSLKELVEKCCFKLKISPEVKQSAAPSVRKTDFDSIQINALEAQLFLNWTPRLRGEETLLAIIEHKLLYG